MSYIRRLAAGVSCAALVASSAGPAGAADPHGKTRTASARRDGRSRESDGGTRRTIAGAPTDDETSSGAETPELRAIRDAELELFPPAAPAQGGVWPGDLPFTMPGETGPRVYATGVPPVPPAVPQTPEGGGDRSWLTNLDMPDLPVRWDDRVVRYLEFFRDDARGRATFTRLLRRSGRYRDAIRRILRSKGMPEDLVYLAMVESGFEAVARSVKGAAGVWQLMPDTAKIYGLTIDRWLDERLGVSQETLAAIEFLGDLHRRFGSWDLALAAYNMGYGGVASIVRRYNTNDFWTLEHTEGTLPWETTLYVPKVLAVAVVARNLSAFGFADVKLDTPLESDDVNAPAATPISLVAQAAGCSTKELVELNPELRASRTPPAADGDGTYPVKVPRGKGEAAAVALAKMRGTQPALDKYVVRFGETLDQIASSHRTTAQRIVDLNAIAPGESVRGGTVLLVPHTDGPAPPMSAPTAPDGTKLGVVVPADEFIYPDRRRVFYRVQVGDTLKEIAGALGVTIDDLDRWNGVDPGARLQEGMTLQAFVPPSVDLSRVVVASESDVRVLPLGSDEFFASLEHDKGFHRVVVTVHAGDTLASIGKRFGVSARTMERVNRRGRRDDLKTGDTVVVYVPVSNPPAGATATASNEASSPAPVPDLTP